MTILQIEIGAENGSGPLEAPKQKNVRTAQGYTDIPGQQDITFFSVVGRADR